MKKITYSIILLLLAVFNSSGQVEFGDGTDVNQHLPFEPARNYSYAQSIYLASEINASGNITSLKWYFNGFGLENSQSLTVYLGHTSKNAFASKTDWEPVANLTQVYSGGMTVTSGQEFITLVLDTPFAYNGNDNLVVAVRETATGADAGDADFFTTHVTGNRSLSYYNNTTVPDPANPAIATTLSAYVPNLIIGGITQLCPKPIDLAVSEITETTAELSWVSIAANPLGGTQYYISQATVTPTPLTAPTGTVASVNFAEITGLTPATAYHVWVRNVCQEGPGVWSAAASFVTQCVAVASINENFDSVPMNSLPTCWSSIVRGPAVTEYAYVRTTDYNAHSGSRAIEFSRDNLLSTETILVFPKVSTLQDNTHRLKFFALNSYGSGTIEIGTLDGNGPDANFTMHQEIPITNSYVEYTIDFTNYGDGTDQFVGIKIGNFPLEYANLYLDDIRWEVVPACPDVTQIAIGALTPNTAAVTWIAGDVETLWDVAIAPSSVTETSALLPAASASETPTATLSGLTSNTSYNVWVRSICNEGAGVWIGPVTFTTACDAINDFYENFDGVNAPAVPVCWTSIIRGDTVSHAKVETNVNNSHSGPNSIALSSGFTALTGNNDVILVSPYLGNLNAQTHRLRFFAAGPGEIEVGTLTSSTTSASFTPIGEPISTFVNSQEYVVDFSTYAESDNYIGIRMHNSGQNAYIYLDDIRWEILPACPDVADVDFSGVSPEAATVGWSQGTASQWQVVYSNAAVTVDPDSLVPSAILNSSSFELTGLTPNTSYNVWVRTVCGGTDGNGLWSNPKVLTTGCSPVTAFTENFDGVSSPALPGCWSTIFRGENVSNFASIGTATFQPYSGVNMVEFSNAGSTQDSDIILVSPALSNLQGAHRLRFFAHNAGTGANLQIGTMGGSQGDGDFTIVSDVTLGGTYQEYSIDFSSYLGADSYIGIRFDGASPYTAVDIDNVVWEDLPLCGDVTAVAVNEITTASAGLTWEPAGTEANWQYVYAESSVSSPEGLVPSALLDANNAVLNGLTANTNYKVWVRSVCGADANGAWIGPVTFATACLATNVPYIEDFEGVLTPALPGCSSTDTAADAINWQTLQNPGSGFFGKVLAYDGLGSATAADAWFFTQGINLTAGTTYSISYKYGNNTTGLIESLQVKYGTSNSAEGMSTEITDHPMVTGGDPLTNVVTFVPPATAVYYFGFRAYSAADQWQLLVDDIVVDSVLSNGDFGDKNFTYYPNPVKNRLNLNYTQTISNVSVFNLLGQKVIEKSIGSTNAQIDMSSLSAGTYIVKVAADNQVKTIKVIKE